MGNFGVTEQVRVTCEDCKTSLVLNFEPQIAGRMYRCEGCDRERVVLFHGIGSPKIRIPSGTIVIWDEEEVR